MKITKNLGEFQKFIDNDNKTGLCLEDTLGFNKLMETYHTRWSCEVFFKDAKQHLQLGKCQCNNFDSQVGVATLAMMQYMMLLLYKQIVTDKASAVSLTC